MSDLRVFSAPDTCPFAAMVELCVAIGICFVRWMNFERVTLTK